MEKKYKGIFAVVCTPFQQDGQIDAAALRAHLRWLIDDCKVHAIIPCGSTGEFAFLTPEERKKVVEITLDEVKHQLPVIPGSAACATQEVIDTARTYQKMGVDGVMVVPSYYGSLKQEELYYHFSTLAKNVELPIVVYNNPGTSGSDMMPDLIARLAEFDNIAAIKESTGQMQRVTEIMRLCGDKIEVLCGCDNLSMEMMAVGVEGWVAAPANVVAKQCVDLYDLMVNKKDYVKARELYYVLLPLFDMFEQTGLYVQLAKAGSRMLGRPIGDPRKPLLPPSKEMENDLKVILDKIYAFKI
jgi:4-hydroxy-tetrahydrodipicolinate synthase